MDGFSVEDSRRIRGSAERTPDNVECPQCTWKLGRSALMKPTKSGAFTTWHCSNCGQDLTIFAK